MSDRGIFKALCLSTVYAISASVAFAGEPPGDPVERAAFDMLDKHCARCHQSDKLENGRLKPAKEFGNVLDLKSMARNRALVHRGNPDDSQLFNLIFKGEMPYDAASDPTIPIPTPEEQLALRKWIETVGTACNQNGILSNNVVVDMIANDLKVQPPHRVQTTRYLSLANLRNNCTDPDEMEVYRQGAVKLLNSLGRTSDVVRLETIDPDKAIIRFNLLDLGWDPAEWESLLVQYKYGLEVDNPLFSFVTGITKSALPFVRADWFAFYVSRPPLYEVFAKIPKTFGELQKQIGIDVDKNIKSSLVKRAGFKESLVSTQNRMIERHPTTAGYFWTSYDFGGEERVQDIFAFPLGPGGDNGFKHDGGESIWSLPNGFQAYYLSTAKGDYLAKGPTSIVHDLSQKDKTVTNGISCMGCHDKGVRLKGDEIRRAVETGDRQAFPKAVRDSVLALYPPFEEMKTLQQGDLSRFVRAMQTAGLNPDLKLNGVEPINALARAYEGPVDGLAAAAELGIVREELARAQVGTAQDSLRRLVQGSIPRTRFEGEFAALVGGALNDKMFTPPKVGAAVAAAPPQPDKPAAPAVAAVVEAYPETPTPGLGAGKPFDLSLTSDKVGYGMNEKAVFTIVSTADCNLTVTNVDNKDRGTILFPNDYEKNNAIKAGIPVVLGKPGDKYQFRLPDQGVEKVVADCLVGQVAPRSLKADFKARGLTDVGDYSQQVVRNRTIVTEPQTAGPATGAPKAGAPGKPPQVAQAIPAPGAGAPAKPPQVGQAVTAPAISAAAPAGRVSIVVEVK